MPASGPLEHLFYPGRVGQNKRYDLTGADVARAAERLERASRPVGLDFELVRRTGRRTDAETPIPVAAWVPHLVSHVDMQLVEAEAIAWTADAVLVRWTPAGAPGPSHAWVWANSVRRR